MTWASKAWTPFVSRQDFFALEIFQSTKQQGFGAAGNTQSQGFAQAESQMMQILDQTEWGAALEAQEGKSTRAALAHPGGDSPAPLCSECFTGHCCLWGQASPNLSSKVQHRSAPHSPQHQEPLPGGKTWAPPFQTGEGWKQGIAESWKKESHATALLASDWAPALPAVGFIRGNADTHFLLRHSTLTRNCSQNRTRSDNYPVPKH